MANYKNIEFRQPLETNIDVKITAMLILEATDWTQIPNNGLTDNCVDLFKTYRASIRTIRRTEPSNPTWPDAPTEEYS